MNDIEILIQKASEARQNAYAPYSKFRVGAALETSVEIISGCNVENASFGATCCAERNAVFAAIAKGQTEMRRIAIISDADDFCFPCGICRQVLYEFAPELNVIVCRANGEYKTYTLQQLLPHAFGPKVIDQTK